jgi:branched-chain amino acid transport system ATP-binding protein
LLAAMGVLPLLGGTVRLRGESLTSQTHRRAAAGMAFVPEDRGVFRDLTVRENLRLRERGRGRTTADAIDWFPELRPLMGRRARLLSGGEQQMLALGGAMLSSSPLLMIDEMSHGLAPIVVQRLARFLRDVAASGTAVLIVEQQVETVLDLADRVLVLNRGRVVLAGPSADLRNDRTKLETSYLGDAVR